MTNKKVTHLRVSSRSGTFRRAGLSFGTNPQHLPLETLSKDAHAALINEPMLDAVMVEVEEASEVDTMPGDQAAVKDTKKVASKPAAKAKN